MSDPISPVNRKRAADDGDSEPTPLAPALRAYCPPSLTAMMDAEQSWLNPRINPWLCRDITNHVQNYTAPALYYHVDRYTRHAYEDEFGAFDLASEEWRIFNPNATRAGLFQSCYSIDHSACHSQSMEHRHSHVVTFGDFVNRGRAAWSVVVPNVGPREMAKIVPQRADLVWGIGANCEWIARLRAGAPPDSSQRHMLPAQVVGSNHVLPTVDSMLCFSKELPLACALQLYDAEHQQIGCAMDVSPLLYRLSLASVAPSRLLYCSLHGTHVCDFRCNRVATLKAGSGSISMYAYTTMTGMHAIDDHEVLLTDRWTVHRFDLRSPAWTLSGKRGGDLMRYDFHPRFALHH